MEGTCRDPVVQPSAQNRGSLDEAAESLSCSFVLVSENGGSRAFLGSLFQCLTTLQERFSPSTQLEVSGLRFVLAASCPVTVQLQEE